MRVVYPDRRLSGGRASPTRQAAVPEQSFRRMSGVSRPTRGLTLDRSAVVPDGSDVKADTKDGVITLTGHVRTWAEHDAVVGAALMARGGVDIRDELEVTG